jgi:hypothetical protein
MAINKVLLYNTKQFGVGQNLPLLAIMLNLILGNFIYYYNHQSLLKKENLG